MSVLRLLLGWPRRVLGRRRVARLRRKLDLLDRMSPEERSREIKELSSAVGAEFLLTVMDLRLQAATDAFLPSRGRSERDRTDASAGSEVKELIRAIDGFQWDRWGQGMTAAVSKGLRGRGAPGTPEDGLAHLAQLRRFSGAPMPGILGDLPALAEIGRLDGLAARAYLEYLVTVEPPAERGVLEALRKACFRSGDQAESVTRAALEILRGSWAAVLLGRYELARSDFVGARARFEEAHRLAGSKDEVPNAFDEGTVLLGLGEWDAAIVRLEALVAKGDPSGRATGLLAVARISSLETSIVHAGLSRDEAQLRLRTLAADVRPGDGEKSAPALEMMGACILRRARAELDPGRAMRALVGLAPMRGIAPRVGAAELVADMGGFGAAGPPEDGRSCVRGRWLLRHGRFTRFEEEYAAPEVPAGGSRSSAREPLFADRQIRRGRAREFLRRVVPHMTTPEEHTYALELRIRALLLCGRTEDAGATLEGPAGLLLPAPISATLRAWVAEARGEWEECVGHLDEALGLVPASASAWTEAGLSYLGLGLDGEARECFLRACRLAGWDAYAHLGCALLATGGEDASDRVRRLEGDTVSLCSLFLQRLKGAGRLDLCRQLLAFSGDGSGRIHGLGA